MFTYTLLHAGKLLFSSWIFFLFPRYVENKFFSCLFHEITCTLNVYEEYVGDEFKGTEQQIKHHGSRKERTSCRRSRGYEEDKKKDWIFSTYELFLLFSSADWGWFVRFFVLSLSCAGFFVLGLCRCLLFCVRALLMLPWCCWLLEGKECHWQRLMRDEKWIMKLTKTFP